MSIIDKLNQGELKLVELKLTVKEGIEVTDLGRSIKTSEH